MDFLDLHHNLNRFSSFSFIKNGLGLALNILGIMAFLLTFKRNLHSMVTPEEQPLPQKSRILRYLNLITCFMLFAFILIAILQFIQIQNIYFLHILCLKFTVFGGIIIPKYYISQDPILKFYVSVYHHHPPPVLSWQVPEHFDPDVKLIVANLKNE